MEQEISMSMLVQRPLYYDQGWNSRIKGDPFIANPAISTFDWREGWRDADDAIRSGVEIEPC